MDEDTPPSRLLDVGEDVLIYLMEYLTPYEICKLSSVCERLRTTSMDDRAWCKIVTCSVVCKGDSGEVLTPRSPYREWYQGRLLYCRSDMINFIQKEENFGFSDLSLENIKSMYKLCKKAMISSTDARNRQAYSSTHARFFEMASRFTQRNRFLVTVLGCSVRGALELGKRFIGQAYPAILSFNFIPRKHPSPLLILRHYHRLFLFIIFFGAVGKPPSWSAIQTGGKLLSSSTLYHLASVLAWETGLYSNLSECDVASYRGLNSPWRRRFAAVFTACQLLLSIRDVMKRRVSSASVVCAPLVVNLLFNTWLFKYHFPLASKLATVTSIGAVPDLDKIITDEPTQTAISRLLLPFYNKQHLTLRVFAYMGTVFMNPYWHFVLAAHTRWAVMGGFMNILIRANTSTVIAIYGNGPGYWFHMFAHLLLAVVPLVTPSPSFDDLYRKGS